MRQLFFLTGVHLTIDLNSFSQISQAMAELKCRSGESLNVVLAPTHRSFFDFLLISYVLFSLPEVQLDLPYIAAAEEFAPLPVLGWLAQYCGAFFIKRGLGQVDKQLSSRISDLKQRKSKKHPICFEIFIEGKRSRDKVFIKPKTGLLK
jgi:glycerol-3-phosphate O-acyltransferase